MCKQTDAHSLRNTQVDTHPQNHMYTEMHTADIHRRKHTDRPTPPPQRLARRNRHHMDTHAHSDPRERTQTNASAHTRHTDTGTLPAPAPATPAGLCPRAPGGRGRSQDGPLPGTPLSSLPGDTHRADRDDGAGHPRASPAHAEPAAKQRRDHCAASSALQAAVRTRRWRARPERRACAVRSRRPRAS